MGRIVAVEELVRLRKKFKRENKKVVFTNGCFDILHRGHVEYLMKAKTLGDVLVVGINSDISVKKIKGEKRPIVNLEDRAFILSSLSPVDYVCPFDEDDPLNLITAVVPDVLVKGADWKEDEIIGRDIVERAGGKVAIIRFTPDRSTSSVIKTILERFK